jgi:formimidoylglutamate deiminase
LKEIEDALAYLNKRPVEWLLDNIEMSDRFHLVHATHLVPSEIIGIAQSKANVVLCPSTEGNLGDGIFPLKEYQNAGGSWSIGTDSHVGLNPFEELRILDYGQRLISHKRNTFYSTNCGDSGLNAIATTLKSGRLAMNNQQQEYFKVGSFFNAVLMDANAPLIAATGLDFLASTFVYATDISMQYGTISHGKLVVEKGHHKNSGAITANFIKTLDKIKNRS